MLIMKKILIILVNLVFLILLTNNSYAKNEYFKCPEKISKVIQGSNQLIREGSIIGTNYIKFNNDFITIKFKELGSNKKAKIIISNKKAEQNTLGYEAYDKNSINKNDEENTYTFIKVNNTYAFTRKKYFWSLENQAQSINNYEYESSGRCIKINNDEYDLEKIVQITKKKIEKKEKLNLNDEKILEGERSFALSWEGYDDLILGKLKFSEKNLLGSIEFSLPENNSSCIGTYVLSKTRGTWSIFCEDENINASGTLKWNSSNGSVSGIGKDDKGKQVKFKVAPIS
jgi:hypothetical protein